MLTNNESAPGVTFLQSTMMCQKLFSALRWHIYWLIIKEFVFCCHIGHYYTYKQQHIAHTYTCTFMISSNNKDEFIELMLFFLCLLNNILWYFLFTCPPVNLNTLSLEKILKWLPVVPECGKKPCYGKKISVFGPELATMLMMFLLWGPRGYKRLC